MMKAVLDHVGIAVTDVGAALAFFRDALGLEVQPPEPVATQGVTVRYVGTGPASIELVEATSETSPVARFLARRGPGLHHVTLRVADLAAALAHLRARGVRLIDETPRPGSHGSRIAFVHPASVHGVLVELKESGAAGEPVVRPPGVTRIPFGDLELVCLSDGFFRLDGGGMFGAVPKTLWERQTRADDRNRILLGLRPLLVRGVRTMLIDAGVGSKLTARSAEIYGLDRAWQLDHSLAAAGVSASTIDIVLATHLHFDHAGGFTEENDGRLRPRFPRAQYIVRRGEWEDALAPNERSRASYLPENFRPLAEAGVLQLVDEDQTIMPGVRVRRTGGHTMHHQMVVIESGGRTAVFVADLIPTTAHVADPWIMGYDLFPLDTLAFKRTFIAEAVERGHLIFFEHDPEVPAGYIRERDGRRFVEPYQD
jgi:methylmalonyl-CoA epimerase